MKFHRLVCLHVPTFRGNNSDGEGRAGAMGTGYQITEELIITSRHVVRPPNRQVKYRISCAWAFGPEGKKGIWTLDQSPEGNDPIVWENEDLDVALLRWKAPDWLMKDDRPAYLSRNPPLGLQEWAGRGFPILGRDQPWKDSLGLHGKMLALADGEVFFDLIDPSGFPDDEYWYGASGTPICRGATEEIVGILNITRNRTGGHRLRATATARLFADPAFGAFFSGPEDEVRRRTCVEAVAKALDKSVLATSRIAAAFGLETNSGPVETAQHLTGLGDMVGVTGKLREVYDTLGDDIATADKDSIPLFREARRALEAAVQWLVPYLCEEHVDIYELRDKVNGAARIIDLPCAITSIAEIYIAAVERRTTAFWPREGQADWPQGKHHLPWRDPPFEGMVQLAKDRAAVHEMFGDKLVVGDVTLDEARVRLDDFMIKNLAYSPGIPRDQKVRKKYAARELENQAKGKFRRYLVCRVPMDDPAKRAAIEDTLMEIARDYPALVIARLYEGSAAPEARDLEFWDFKDMLPLEGEQASGAP